MGAEILVIEHESDAGVGILGAALRDRGARLTLAGPGVGRPVPHDIGEYDGLIVLGGTPGPVDDDTAPWLPSVRHLIGEALRTEVPYLGVCLGAQLLAVVAGGEVGDARRPEVGLVELELTDAGADDPLFSVVGGKASGFEWHFLEVTSLPAGSVSLCRSSRCRNQAFRVGRSAWGVQFHLEADVDTAVRWARPAAPNPELQKLSLTPGDVVDPVVAAQPDLQRQWTGVAQRWLGLVETSSRPQGVAEEAS